MNLPEGSPELLPDVKRWLEDLRQHGLAGQSQLQRLEQLLAESRGERLDVEDDPLLVVLLAGPTAVGKSSLINALAGAEISPVGLGATTAAPVLFVHRGDDISRLADYGRDFAALAGDGISVVRHDRRELAHTVLIDTPDIDSVRRHHRAITEALVHAADLVLFVTTPETYKTVDAARWIAAQRGRRGMAFVLNKWDRAAIGIGYDRRGDILQDLRATLAMEGFADPAIFLTSTQDWATLGAVNGADNQFGALSLWLTDALRNATAQALSTRRRHAAWRRLDAAIAEAAPAPLGDDPDVKAVARLLGEGRDLTLRLAGAEAFALQTPFAGRNLPNLPGLLGATLRLGGRLAGAARSLRAVIPASGSSDPAATAAQPHFGKATAAQPHFGQATAPPHFGQVTAATLLETTRKIARDARTARLPLGPVGSAWEAAGQTLGERLAVLPATVEADLLAKSRRLSFRRALGIAALALIEILILGVVLMVLWRTGYGFLTGAYATLDLPLDALALIVALLLLGQFAAGLFFPATQAAFHKALDAAATRVLAATWQQVDAALDAQIAAAASLNAEGQKLRRRIDLAMRAARRDQAADGEIQNLFGAAPAESRDGPTAPVT